MEIIPLTDPESLLWQKAQTFVSKNEEKCLALMNRILNGSARLYGIIDNQKHICGVFSYSFGGQLLHIINLPETPAEKNALFIEFKKLFEEEKFKKLFSIIGLSEGGDFISSAYNEIRKTTALHQLNYDLMEFDSYFQNEISPDDSKILCATTSMMDELYPVQMAYELEEVIIDRKNFNEESSRLNFKNNLAKGLVYILKNTEKIISKLTINAKGKKYVQIGGMYTLPEYRNKSYGRRLLLKICKKYADSGKKIVLFVKKNNPAAIRLYENAGFRKFYDYKILYY